MPNPNGDTGNSTTVVLGDKVVVVGDNPNTNPAVYTDPTGRDTDAYGFIDDSGMIQAKTALPTFTPIDNASDFHGGNYTITAMNAIHFESGGGGLSADINGSIALSSWGGIVNITSTNQVSAQAEVVQLACTNTVLLTGPTFYVDTEETIFNKNVKFGCNVAVNGGLAVAGELYAAHITGVRQTRVTQDCGTLYGHITKEAMMECVITGPIISTGGTTIDGGIPAGAPISIAALIKPVPSDKAFVAINGHEHLFESIACSTCDDHAALNKEMANTEKNEPVDAKPNLPMDMSWSNFLGMLKNRVQKRFTKFMKEILGLG